VSDGLAVTNTTPMLYHQCRTLQLDCYVFYIESKTGKKIVTPLIAKSALKGGSKSIESEKKKP
jgi:hypothetical protein